MAYGKQRQIITRATAPERKQVNDLSPQNFPTTKNVSKAITRKNELNSRKGM